MGSIQFEWVWDMFLLDSWKQNSFQSGGLIWSLMYDEYMTIRISLYFFTKFIIYVVHKKIRIKIKEVSN